MAFSMFKDGGGSLWGGGRFSIFPEERVVHAVSTRHGGVSRPPYDTMNLALHVGDDAAAVAENRRLFFASLGLDAARLVTPRQVHGDAVVRVGTRDAGRGAWEYADAISAADALMTDEAGLPLMLCFADCTPVLLFDPAHHAIAVAHGGWKGTARAIAAKTVRAMGEAFGTRPEDCLAGIGPAIGPCCYTVGAEVTAAFRAAFPDFAEEIIDERGGAPRLDLPRANRLQLEAAGLERAHIDMADVCTSCHARDFFSYRAEGPDTGRIAAVMALR